MNRKINKILDKIEFTTSFIGCQYIYLPECHSTNDYAMELVRNDLPREGCIINTDNQLNGRGQRGNVWISKPNENLTFSVILKPTFLAISQQFVLNMVVSLALVSSLKSCIPLTNIKIKWPNDIFVLYNNTWKKIGGILIENVVNGHLISNSIIGIGLNINQTSFESLTATSLKLIGLDVNRAEMLRNIVSEIESLYLQLRDEKIDELKIAYTKLLYGYGEVLNFEVAGKMVSGVILGINNCGLLSVNIDHKVCTFDLKEIKFIIN